MVATRAFQHRRLEALGLRVAVVVALRIDAFSKFYCILVQRAQGILQLLHAEKQLDGVRLVLGLLAAEGNLHTRRADLREHFT